jgi:hypothetical protein
MLLPSTPHTETLFRIYLGLLAIAVVLGGVLANRHVTGVTAEEIVVAAPRAPAARGPGPAIHWGGQKR